MLLVQTLMLLLSAVMNGSLAQKSATERLFWESIKDSSSILKFQEYLRQFPDGVFAGLARIEIDALLPTRESRSAKGTAGVTFATVPPTVTAVATDTTARNVATSRHKLLLLANQAQSWKIVGPPLLGKAHWTANFLRPEPRHGPVVAKAREVGVDGVDGAMGIVANGVNHRGSSRTRGLGNDALAPFIAE
jgi:hypothetical protein